MRNPLVRLIHRDPAKPTLRERAAALKAHAARVLRRPKYVEAELVQTAPVADPLTVSEETVSDGGMVSFRDDCGTLHRTTVADWIGFMAGRMNAIARREASRQFNAACNDLDVDAASDLWDRIRREHRLDAVDSLAFRWRKVFEAAKGYTVGHVEYIAATERRGKAGRPAGGSDAALLALGGKWRTAQAAYDEAWERHDTLRPLVQEPAAPEALFTRPDDVRLGIARLANERADGKLWYAWAASPDREGKEDNLRNLRTRERPTNGPPRPSWGEARERAAEICAAYDGWKAEAEAARAAVGLGEVEARTMALGQELQRLDAEIASAAATTLAGLRVKALVAQSHLEEDDDPHGLLIGLLRDVLALKDTAPLVGAGPKIDYGATSMEDLRRLHELAECIDRVCDGFMSHPWRETTNGHFKAPGTFVDWILAECDRVLTDCRQEAAQRRPLGVGDMQTRLAILARAVIDNDDKAETAAFARDLQATAA